MTTIPTAEWLSGAYIVENEAIDYERNGVGDLSSRPTNVTVTGYREFVSTYPTRTSYFQPVIENLEYRAPLVVGEGPFLIVEGITDYHALRLVSAERSPGGISVMPGAGAGASGPLVSLLMGRGDRFLLLLDDDEIGRRQADRYRETWLLSEDAVVTLGELDGRWRGMALEGMFSEQTLANVKVHARLNRAPTKRDIGLFLAECCVTGDLSLLSAATADEFRAVLNAAEHQLLVDT